MSQITLIENGELYTPQYEGRKSLLLSGSSISEIDHFSSEEISGIPVSVIDASDCYVVPGFVDGHVHICGGGGEGGFKTRTPEISLSDLIRAGVTSVIGVLGTDGTTRTMSNLIAKALGLIDEGISAWVLTGSYQVPVRTLTGSITDDIILIDRIIGTGEIAISDHRSSHPSIEKLASLAADSRLGGILSGKGGVVNIHMGDGRQGLYLLNKLIDETEIPHSQLLPTHMNRNARLFEEAIDYALRGGFVDFTTSTTKQFIDEGEIPAAKALKNLLEKGVPLEKISFSSDGQGSLPQFDSEGKFIGLGIGKNTSLHKSLCEAVFDHNLPLDKALSPLTCNPAAVHKLPHKGRLVKGYDSDILLLEKKSLEIDTVIARGKILMRHGEILEKGIFE